MKLEDNVSIHPHSHPHEIILIVNGREREYSEKTISYEQVVHLAFNATDPNMVYTVTYKRGDHHKPEGRMVEGDTVTVKEGMIFNVTPTRKS